MRMNKQATTVSTILVATVRVLQHSRESTHFDIDPPSLSFLSPVASNRCDPTIHEQLNPIHKTRIARSQKQRGRSNLLRAPNLPPRYQRSKVLLCVGSQWIKNRCVDRSRTQHIHPYLPVFELKQPCPCKRSHRGFARAIDAEPRKPLCARDRCVHKNRPTIVEKGECLLHCKQRAPHIQVEDAIELFRSNLSPG